MSIAHASYLQNGLRLVAFFSFLLGISSSFAAQAALTAEQLAPIRQEMDDFITKEIRAKKLAGLSIALVDDQKIVWAQGFGFSNKARQQPARADTLYSVGALSTLLTATALLQLVDQGAVELDRPIKKYLPDFNIRSRFTNTPAITTRHLLSHHSGLPAMHFKAMWTPRPEALSAFVARLKDEYVAYPPAHVFSPSFPAYDVLGRVLEINCKKSFANCMQERVLAPLGMQHSTFEFNRANRALVAMHYWKQKPLSSQTVRDIPAAGLVSSVEELARFVQMLFADGKSDGKQILKAQTVQEMMRVQNADVALDLDTDVGLGWRLSGVQLPQTRNVVWLSNESPTSRGRMVLAPVHKLGVIVLTNSSNSTELVEKASERLLELVLLNKTGVPLARPVTVVAPPAAQRREDIIGHYATALGLISVKPGKGGYRAHMLGKNISLKREAGGLLTPEYRLLGLIPIPISVLKEARMTTIKQGPRHLVVAYYRNHLHRLGERIEPQNISSAWKKRLGDYQVVERDPLLDLVKFTSFSLLHENGLMTLRYEVPGWLGLVANIPLRPVSDTELILEGNGWLMGETVHIVQRGGQEHLRYSGYEFRLTNRP